ncbi:MAG: phosphatidylglycerol lysyltransferase, partial [Treponema sp.]|nr:phosphatidylglycerol lysyltransferase [Treponema sp.]
LRPLLAAREGTAAEVMYTGVTAIPEFMAFARSVPATGFIYISASHNPIGHNGLKFGLGDGGMLPPEESNRLISAFRSLMSSPLCVMKAEAFAGASVESLATVYASERECKKAALAAYRDFAAEIISGIKDKAGCEEFFSTLRRGLEKQPLGIAADFNGSARAVSIDREFFTSLGVAFRALNETPGEIAHRIVPEGESLEPCRAFLDELHRENKSFILGYTCDCDGDRGNLVYFDDREKRTRILEAQEVFALACVAELSFLVSIGELKYDESGNAVTKAAIAVNDPTSIRIERIARAFGVDLFRAEVGEANVVGLAKRLRDKGYLVRILGEGSNGGTIIHPSAVRDPVNTVGAILKLLAMRGGKGENDRGLFEIWCGRSNQGEIYRDVFTLSDIIAALPAFVTTGVATDDAILRIKTTDHGILKERYQKIFVRDWGEKKRELHEKYGISGWEAIAYNGMNERRGIGSFSEAGRGGLKIEFTGTSKLNGKDGEKTAFIWMRGSGTEPVFRIMADAECIEAERELIEWQRQMVLEADAA